MSALAGLALIALSGCTPEQPTPSQETEVSWGEKFASCMTEKGWVTQVEDDGGVVVEWTDAQEDVYVADSDECSSSIGIDTELTPAEYEAAYEALILNRECLIDQGYELPEPPTFQAWMDIGAAWNPWADLPPNLTAEQFTALNEACPQVGA